MGVGTCFERVMDGLNSVWLCTCLFRLPVGLRLT